MSRATQTSLRTAGRWLFGSCIAVSAYGYVSGWPVWLLMLLLCGVPFLSFCHWMYTGRLRRYRFLFGIYLVVAVIGVFEAWEHRKIPKSVAESVDLPVGPGEPDVFMEYDLPGVLLELYPERSEVLFVRGFQMKLCQDDVRLRRQYSVCDQFKDTDLNTVREYFEVALSRKPKTDENLYYHYVEVLMRLEAPESEIDAATKNWQRMFPLSERPDPRQAFARAIPAAES